MGSVSEALDWGLLGQDPAPGDPPAIVAAAARLRAAAAQAGGIAGRVTGHAMAAGEGWQGGAAASYADAVGALGPQVDVLAQAATAASAALTGHANALDALQQQARDVLQVAQEADQARLAAEAQLEVLHGQHTAAEATYEQRHLDWRAAQRDADQALASGAQEAGALQQAASRARLLVNDALAEVARLEQQIADAGADLLDAEQRLQTARTDAERIAMEATSLAVATAARLPAIPPVPEGLLGALVVPAAGAAAPPSAPSPPRPPTVHHDAPTAPAAATPAGPPPAPQPIPTGPPPVPAEDMVRVASMLAVVRMTRTPIAIDHVRPTLEEFRRQQRRGLQDVTARGAAVARALGFEGDIGGLGWRPTPTDHSKGLAIDLMTYDDVATGQALADFYRDNHEDLGVTYIIWNGQICSPRMDWAWRPYTHPAGRTDPTAMHLDHVHVSFDPSDNAYACACFGVTA